MHCSTNILIFTNCLFTWKSEQEKEKKLPKQPQYLSLDQPKTRCQKLHLSLPPEPSSTAFPGALAGNRTGSGTAGTQADILHGMPALQGLA